MPWCPNCKNEYVEGITVCADCGAALVDSLEEADSVSEDAEQEQALGEWEDVIDGMPQYGQELCSKEEAAESAGVYEDSAKKAEEFKSGAYMLLLVGVLGLIVLVLLIAGVLPIRLNPSSQWMTCLVMGALFVVFIVMGVLSLQSSKKLSEKGKQEASQKEEILQFVQENLSAEQVDSAAGVEDADGDELRYFKRTEQMKQQLLERFPELEAGYLDHLADELYPQLFEQE